MRVIARSHRHESHARSHCHESHYHESHHHESHHQRDKRETRPHDPGASQHPASDRRDLGDKRQVPRRQPHSMWHPTRLGDTGRRDWEKVTAETESHHHESHHHESHCKCKWQVQGVMRVIASSRDPLQGSAWSRCKNPKCFFCEFVLARATLCGIGVAKVQKTQGFLVFSAVLARPSAGIGVVKLQKLEVVRVFCGARATSCLVARTPAPGTGGSRVRRPPIPPGLRAGFASESHNSQVRK